MGGASHQRGSEKGIWFEIKCVRDVIASKKARGEDAKFEEKLLRHWSKYEGWEDASVNQTKPPNQNLGDYSEK